MSQITLPEIKRHLRRVLLNGPPNTRKTSSLRTLPGQLVAITCPQEDGLVSMPFKTTDGTPVIHLTPMPTSMSSKTDWSEVIKHTHTQITDVLAGKYGKVEDLSIAFDGAHKYYDALIRMKGDGSPSDLDEKDVGRVYWRAGDAFWKTIDSLIQSPAKTVVVTCWDSPEKDEALDDSRAARKAQHKWPGLPGKGAKHSTGEFSMVLYANITMGPDSRYFWQCKPGGHVWGASIKLPVDLVVGPTPFFTIPKELEHEDFSKLFSDIDTQLDKAWEQTFGKGVAA